jgi:hypothetical protein
MPVSIGALRRETMPIPASALVATGRRGFGHPGPHSCQPDLPHHANELLLLHLHLVPETLTTRIFKVVELPMHGGDRHIQPGPEAT